MTRAREYMGSALFGTLTLLLFFIFATMNGLDVRSALAQTTLDHSFTYQGYLENGGSPVNANCDFRFQLYNALTGGSQIGSTIDVTNLSVDRGVFSTKLNFGNVFSTQRRWLSIAVRCPAGGGSYTTLSPRTEITSVPISGAMRNLATTGAVGINTVNPTSQLDVNGNIRSTSSIRVTTAGTTRALVTTLSSGAGFFETRGSNGNLNTALTTVSGASNQGYVAVFNSSGNLRSGMYVNDIGAGIVHTRGPNGNSNVALTTLSGASNNGYLSVQNSAGTTRAGIYVDSSGNGIVWGNTKNFRMPNPNDAETEIWYASLEGPEAAAYVRGTARLIEGQATITFPDHFLAVASEQGITVQLTPLSAESLGLAVVQKSLEGIVIQEMHQGRGSYEFDFFVTAVRRGYEDYEVVRPISAAQPLMDVPEAADDRITEPRSEAVINNGDE